jgi:hypothetical protein
VDYVVRKPFQVDPLIQIVRAALVSVSSPEARPWLRLEAFRCNT